MSDFLGIDTSNYTTSAAIYESHHNVLLQEKMLLPVKKGEKGIRQSDAVFHHTVQLPEIIDKLFTKTGKGTFPLWAFHMLRGDWKAHICRAF